MKVFRKKYNSFCKHARLGVGMLLLNTSFLQAQDLMVTSGTAQVEFPDTKSKTEVLKEAQELAEIDALERAFGRVIVQGNATYVSNVNTGQKTETFSSFVMKGNSYVKGEVIEVMDTSYRVVTGTKRIQGKQQNYQELIFTITVKARELNEIPVEFNTYPLALPNPKAIKTEFKSNDFLYLYFNSPVSGYVYVFLDDNKDAYRLLPYRSMPSAYELGMPVEADKEYIFFSTRKEHNYITEDPYFTEDQYQLVTTGAHELNRLYIIYSPQPMVKPAFSKQESLTELTLPLSLPSGDFQKWLIRARSMSKQVQYKPIDITIVNQP